MEDFGDISTWPPSPLPIFFCREYLKRFVDSAQLPQWTHLSTQVDKTCVECHLWVIFNLTNSDLSVGLSENESNAQQGKELLSEVSKGKAYDQSPAYDHICSSALSDHSYHWYLVIFWQRICCFWSANYERDDLYFEELQKGINALKEKKLRRNLMIFFNWFPSKSWSSNSPIQFVPLQKTYKMTNKLVIWNTRIRKKILAIINL